MPPRPKIQTPTPTTTRIKTAPTAPDDLWGTSLIKALVYGQSGSGKTTLIGDIALHTEGKTMWLLCSGGKKPGELKSINTPAHREKIVPKLVSSSEKFEEHLREAGGYENVVLDHLTGFSDLKLKELLGIDQLPAQKGWGMASQQTYGTLGLQVKESLRALLSLDANVYVIAQERTFNGGDDGTIDGIKPTIGAAVTPSVLNWLAPACDYVLQMFKRPLFVEKDVTVAGKTKTVRERVLNKIEHCLRLETHDVVMTKFRAPKGTAIPDVIADPDYAKFMAAINGEYGG